jgi:tRNA nucleotidyltransferase (CCA-adding enzyme)
MEGSPNPGKGSSQSLRSRSQIERELRELSSSLPIQSVVAALGSDAELYLVGGIVRDVAEGVTPGDLDLATVLRPEEVVRRLEVAGIRVVPTGLQHGTVLAVIDGVHLEITTFRRPGAQYGATIQEDLSGRDFTINALAFSLKDGELLDQYQSLEDIASRLLRGVGSARDRFEEDPLRVLRAIRFGPAAGRSMTPEVRVAISQVKERLRSVSPERIRLELERILIGTDPAAGVRELAGCGLLELILPEALPSIGCDQNRFHTQDVFEHTLTVIERAPRDLTLRLTGLFHDLGKPATLSVDEDGNRHFYKHEEVSAEIAQQVMGRLRFSNEMSDRVQKLVRLHMRPVDCGPAGVRRLLRDLGDDFEAWRTFKFADSPPIMSDEEVAAQMRVFDEKVATEIERRNRAGGSLLKIRGQDLLDAGLREGPRVGAILRQLGELVLEDPTLNERDKLLELAAALNEKLTGNTPER